MSNETKDAESKGLSKGVRLESDGPKKVVLRKKGTFKAASPPGAGSPSGKRASFPRPEGGKPASRYPVRKPAAAREAPRKAAVSWRAAVEPKPSFPELLAPVGSVENYFAAVAAGADAVYLGLQQFNARERAENLTLADLCRILPHARRSKVRVYLALNTLLTETDLP